MLATEEGHFADVKAIEKGLANGAANATDAAEYGPRWLRALLDLLDRAGASVVSSET